MPARFSDQTEFFAHEEDSALDTLKRQPIFAATANLPRTQPLFLAGAQKTW